jgi:hypothetical protein
MTTPPLDYAPPAKAAPSTAARITGWILSAIPILMVGVLPIIMMLTNPKMISDSMGKYGYPQESIHPVLIAEICCALLYAIPQTAVLGAILLSAYLGGAVATHVHAGEASFWFPPIFAVLAWTGLLLREPRLRSLLPIRKL